MIQVEHMNKTFKVSRRSAGFSEALKALFHREAEIIHALYDISFTIGDGEMVGYIGPNGAGKSSTIKILSGILTPDNGTCLINGRIPWKERREHVKDIGVVFGQRSQLWWDVPILDSFELLRDIYEIPTNQYQETLDELTGLLSLGELLRTPARQLSLGQRMRCEIAASLLHRPKILFLDEPPLVWMQYPSLQSGTSSESRTGNTRLRSFLQPMICRTLTLWQTGSS
uniref:ABC transporter ATP-binding protein n=1 Tax=Clostridium sp. NkU-1 TaxID=1095009 RepID=UPI000A72575A